MLWAITISIIGGPIAQLEQKFLSSRKNSTVDSFFGNLKVRPKLMVLHNLFFLVLAGATYFALIPLFEDLASQTRVHETVFQIGRAHV